MFIYVYRCTVIHLVHGYISSEFFSSVYQYICYNVFSCYDVSLSIHNTTLV